MTTPVEHPLLAPIRAGDPAAWKALIDEFEGRLTAFIDSRLRNRASSEELVQETFLGFLVSLPNYDARTPLESWLFAIAAHKLTDHLRKSGKRPAVSLAATPSGESRIPAPTRAASGLLRSRERIQAEEAAIAETLQSLIAGWKANGEWARLKCLELLFVQGLKNKEVAEMLQISEQDVANHKAFALSKLKQVAT
jgi:RNA polymerase sigma-70 factor (ECF subfamily)